MDITIDIEDYKLNVRAAAVIIHNNKVLVHRNLNSEHYALIGGRVEIGEDSENTVKREIQEELGKQVEVIEYVSTIENFFEMKNSKYHEILFVHKAEFIDDEDKKIEYTLKNTEGKDYLQYEWLQLDKIDQYPLWPKAIQTVLKEGKFPVHKINKDMVNHKLTTYVQDNIFPLYSRNEEGHGINHIKTVIEKSLKFAKEQNANLDMAYAIAAYHDLGHYIDRKTHEIISAKMFIEDENMKRFFTEEQIEIIREAIEDHRASSDHKPRSIYGMIVSTADRTIIDTDNAIKRSYSYGKRNYIGLSEEELIERVYEHLKEKYGENGYAKVYLEDKEFEEALQKLRHALDDRTSFLKRVKEVVKQI